MKNNEKTNRKSTDNNISFDNAKVDSSHCLTDGLFRPLSRAPKREPLDVTHVYMGYTMRWLNYCKLNIVDQSVFLAIHKLASDKGRVERVDEEHESPVMKEVRSALQLEKDAAKSACLVLDTTLYEIAKIMGYTDSGANLSMIKKSLIKLSCVCFLIYKGNKIEDTFFKTNLFSRLAGKDGKIHVGINPMLGKALTGGQFCNVSMAEQRILQGDITKRLHLWLSSWMRAGDTRKIELDKLVPHVWCDMAESATLRKRRHMLRKSIVELNALDGWDINENNGELKLSRIE